MGTPSPSPSPSSTPSTSPSPSSTPSTTASPSSTPSISTSTSTSTSRGGLLYIRDTLSRPLQPFEPLVVSQFRVGGRAPSPSPSPRLPAGPTGSTGSSPWPLSIALSLAPTS